MPHVSNKKVLTGFLFSLWDNGVVRHTRVGLVLILLADPGPDREDVYLIKRRFWS